MKQLIPTAQLYTVRDACQTVEGIRKSLKKVAEMGYRSVQVSGTGPIDAELLASYLKEYGLTCCVTHSPFDRMLSDLPAMIAEHKAFGCPIMGIGAMPSEYRTSAEGFVRFASIANGIAKELAANGMKLSYHNHHFEFAKFDGKTGFELLLEHFDPENIEFVLDTYWVQAGGANPSDYIRRVNGRMTVCHLKDMVVHDLQQRFAEVGEGNLDFDAILTACEETAVRYVAVEQDDCYGRDPFESLAISCKNLLAMLGKRA